MIKTCNNDPVGFYQVLKLVKGGYFNTTIFVFCIDVEKYIYF